MTKGMAMKGIGLALASLAMCAVANAATISLDGLWDFKLEAGKAMEEVADLPAFAANDKMIVPGAWDAMSHYYNKRGTGCYRRTFKTDWDATSARLVVDGMGLRARFWLDGRDLGLVKLPWSRCSSPSLVKEFGIISPDGGFT